MTSHFWRFSGLYSGCQRLKMLTFRVRLKEYSSSMSRSQFSRLVPSFVLLFVVGSFSAAFANPRSTDGQASTDQPQADQTQNKNGATDNTWRDPPKRESNEKQKKRKSQN